MGKVVQYKRPDGGSVNGYLAEADKTFGSVVVIQEWWGINDQIRGVADRFAKAGFTALVPDLYRGKSTVEAEEAHHLMSGLNFGDAASQDVHGAVQFLKARGGKVGVTGYCMGGALTVLSLTMSPEVDAGVVWYGYPPLEYVDASKIKAPVQAHWATQDQAFAIAGVDALEEKLSGAGVRYEGHRYLAHHAFANETAQGPGRIPITQYDATWAQLAWDRTLRFFGKELAA
ncbi:dienelactone hydrolase family protein [Variovorax sp. Sphag1AA]|uniref:dienelactone hydrolase family protein n=1 Tax=Variovorax sp. Sphag1AA TaxID=2587027 RepID=UPI001611615C|nr:dienelactone hydrolase family protein [Variovorax sp. Sphag1AA]MBB3178944.1 carboxymethylenebutenolidase [Variovorax sp. Sphag1AA]